MSCFPLVKSDIVLIPAHGTAKFASMGEATHVGGAVFGFKAVNARRQCNVRVCFSNLKDCQVDCSGIRPLNNYAVVVLTEHTSFSLKKKIVFVSKADPTDRGMRRRKRRSTFDTDDTTISLGPIAVNEAPLHIREVTKLTTRKELIEMIDDDDTSIRLPRE